MKKPCQKTFWGFEGEGQTQPRDFLGDQVGFDAPETVIAGP